MISLQALSTLLSAIHLLEECLASEVKLINVIWIDISEKGAEVMAGCSSPQETNKQEPSDARVSSNLGQVVYSRAGRQDRGLAGALFLLILACNPGQSLPFSGPQSPPPYLEGVDQSLSIFSKHSW